MTFGKCQRVSREAKRFPQSPRNLFNLPDLPTFFPENQLSQELRSVFQAPEHHEGVQVKLLLQDMLALTCWHGVLLLMVVFGT